MKRLSLGILVSLICKIATAQWAIASTPTTNIQGIACLGSISNPGNLATTDPLDYVSYAAPLGVGCLYSMRVPLTATVPAGERAGFRISSGTLATVLGNLRIRTYLNGALQESATGGNLLDLAVGNSNEVFFITTKAFNSIVLDLYSVASVLQEMRVYNILPTYYTVLPIYFKNFRVHSEGTRRHISWEQFSDEAIQAVYLEQSDDGQRFRSLATYHSATTDKQHFTANSQDRVWYRLRGVTVSGKQHLSEVVTGVPVPKEPKVTVLSVAGENLVLVNHGAPQTAQVRIISMGGQLVWEGTRTLSTRTAIPFPGVPAGLYKIIVQSGGMIIQASVIH